MKWKRRAIQWTLGLLLTVATLFSLGWGIDRLAWRDSIDYGKRPPAEVFQRVLGQAVPKGVSEIRASGRSGPLGLKHWVWMRFRVTPQAVRTLVAPDRQVDRAFADEKLLRLPRTGMRFVREDQGAVQWGEATHIANPEFYMIGSVAHAPFVWGGTLILDRKNGTAYVQAFGD
jgi:hypothetical protein